MVIFIEVHIHITALQNAFLNASIGMKIAGFRGFFYLENPINGARILDCSRVALFLAELAHY